jgi:hypothetical protein
MRPFSVPLLLIVFMSKIHFVDNSISAGVCVVFVLLRVLKYLHYRLLKAIKKEKPETANSKAQIVRQGAHLSGGNFGSRQSKQRQDIVTIISERKKEEAPEPASPIEANKAQQEM